MSTSESFFMSRERPLIGITADLFEPSPTTSPGRWSATVALAYCEHISAAGGIPS